MSSSGRASCHHACLNYYYQLNHYNAYHQYYPVLTQVCILRQVLHTCFLLENDRECLYTDINSHANNEQRNKSKYWPPRACEEEAASQKAFRGPSVLISGQPVTLSLQSRILFHSDWPRDPYISRLCMGEMKARFSLPGWGVLVHLCSGACLRAPRGERGRGHWFDG